MSRIDLALANKTAAERHAIKIDEISKKAYRDSLLGNFSGTIGGARFDVEVLQLNVANPKRLDAAEFIVRAHRNGSQVAFSDGTVEAERIRLFSLPILVPNPTGLVRRAWIDSDGVPHELFYDEDPAAALKQLLLRTVNLIWKPGDNLVRGKVGSTTSTFSPQAGVGGGNTTADGTLRSFLSPDTTWAALLGVSSCEAVFDTVVAAEVVRTHLGGSTNTYQRCYRYQHTYATGAGIPDTDTVSSATSTLVGESKADTTSIGIVAALVTVTPGADNDVAASDWPQFGATSIANTINHAAWNAAGANDFGITDLSVISKTGITRLGNRSEHDRTSTSPPWTSGGAIARLNCHHADATGTSNDPVLTVVHAAAGVSGSAAETKRAADDTASGAKGGVGSAVESIRVVSTESALGTKGGGGSASSSVATPASSASGFKNAAGSASEQVRPPADASAGAKGAAGSTSDNARASDAASGSKGATGSASDFHQSPASHAPEVALGPSGSASDSVSSPTSEARGSKQASGSAGDQSRVSDVVFGAAARANAARDSAASVSCSASGFKGGTGSTSERVEHSDSAATGSKAAAGSAADFLVLVDAATGFKAAFGEARELVISPSSFATKTLPYSRFFLIDRSGPRYTVVDRSGPRFTVKEQS